MPFRPRHDVDDEAPPWILGTGQAYQLSGPPEDQGRHLGAILLPDPEERRGWRAWYVYPAARPGDERRPVGFRKP